MGGHCEICGKHKTFGHNVSHSKRRTNREFRPNLQRKQLMIDGKLRRVIICANCMRTLAKNAR